jgi:type II secretory ATPase GspE/PulE/Tfp pilus assembly ATPase PilB-like protein
MGNLDAADHLKPQDGRARIRVAGNDIGYAFHVFAHLLRGEKIVIRLLDPRAAQRSLIGYGIWVLQRGPLGNACSICPKG